LYVVIACCAIGRRQLEQPLTRDLINPLATQGKPHAAEEVISLGESPKHANFRLSPGAIWDRRLISWSIPNMSALRALIMALPIAVMSIPAAAGSDFSGSWTVTLMNAHPASLDGQSACFDFTETGTVDNRQDSGTFTIAGTSVAGQYYLIDRVLMAFASLPNNGYLVLTGRFDPTQDSLMHTSFLEVVSGQISTATFTATSDCS
jgi:hypothetical protein